MKTLVNGINKIIAFRQKDIKREASYSDGLTSIVIYNGPRTEISISQHGSGDWDLTVDGEPQDEYNEEDADDAVKEFIRLVQNAE